MTQPRFSPALLTAAACAVLLVLAAHVVGQAPPPALAILSKDGRRSLALNVAGGEELVFLDDLASAFQLTIRDESFGAVAVGYKGKTVLLTPDQPLVSVAGRLVSLPAPPTRNGRRILVPVEFISRALSLIYDARLDLRKASRVLVVGDWRMPRVTIRLDPADPSRIVMDAAPRTESVVSQQNNALFIKFDADALDVAVPAFQPVLLVQAMRLLEPVTLAIDLGPRFSSFRASTQPLDNSTRLTLEVMPAASDPAPAAPAPSIPFTGPPPDVSLLGQPAGGLRTITIDAGHGGEDEGVKGAGGTKEKDLALAMSRRLKSVFEARLGIRVMMTRDDDRNVALVNRVATANNGKADLFISIHANASFQKTASGASILYAAFDREAERSSRAAIGTEHLPAFGGGFRDVELVLWDLAQLRHVGRSGELAALLQEQLRNHVPLSAHAVERAPLEVLESANMPAVLIEMGYLTNAKQESLLNSPEFQNSLAQAIFDAVSKFRDSLGGRRTVTRTRKVWLAVLGVGTAAAVAWLLFSGLPRWFGRGRARPAAAAAPTAVPSAGRKIKAGLFYVAEDGMRLTRVEREVAFGETPVEQARQIIEAQMAPVAEPLVSAVPPDAKLRAIFISERGEAFLDLSKEIVTGHSGGSTNELLTIYTLVNTLCANLPAIHSVQLLVEGKQVETLAGHVDLRHPLEPNLGWIQ